MKGIKLAMKDNIHLNIKVKARIWTHVENVSYEMHIIISVLVIMIIY